MKEQIWTIVTGCNGRVGRFLSIAAGRTGRNVIGAYHSNEESLEKLKLDFRAACGNRSDLRFEAIKCDLASLKGAMELVEQIDGILNDKKVRIEVVFAHGRNFPRLFASLSESEIAIRGFIHFTSVAIITKTFLENMCRQKTGAFSICSSDAISSREPGLAEYAASKAACELLFSHLEHEYRKFGITFNSFRLPKIEFPEGHPELDRMCKKIFT